MKFKLWFILLFVFCSFCGLSRNPVLYNQSIVVAPLKDEVFEKSVADLKLFLEKATKSQFSVRTGIAKPEKGIYIFLNEPGLLPKQFDTMLGNGGIENFVLSGDKDKLLIIACHPQGLSRGIYSYLDRLGFRWYLPKEEWIIIPKLTSIVFNGIRHEKPFLDMRDFFGTGGIRHVEALDPTFQLNEDWKDWKRRNRFGGQYNLGGHYGEIFNITHRKELEANPEYLAMVNGKRQWSVSAKWCISNKNLRELFVVDRVAELKRRLQESKYSNETIVVSVDPADGGGECEDKECIKMGTANDRIFFLANEVAKELRKVSPRGRANIYAYNTHPAPPPFKLDDRLIVQLVPYAFQSIGTPEQMIQRWQKAHSNIHMYDYYGIPDWHWNLPLSGQKLGLIAYLERVKGWKEVGMKGFFLESSFSAASTALGLYFLSRWGWNPAENTGVVLEKFYKQLFGNASPYIKTYFEKIAVDYKGSADLPYLLEQLAEAESVSTDETIQRRIDFLKSYTHYLVLLYKHEQSPQDDQLINELYTYILQLYSSGAIHSTRIAELLYNRLPANSPYRNSLRLDNLAAKVRSLEPLTKKRIAALFAEDRKNYPQLPGFPYQAGAQTVRYTLNERKALQTPTQEGMLINNWPETLVQSTADGTVHFYIKLRESSTKKSNQKFPVRLTDTATGREVAAKTIEISYQWQLVSFKVPSRKVYQLALENKDWIRFIVPENQWLAFKTIPTYTVLGKLWFYATSHDTFLYYTNKPNDQPIFFDPKGRKIEAEKINDHNIYRVKLDTANSGWWSVTATEYKFLQFYDKELLFFPYNHFVASGQDISRTK